MEVGLTHKLFMGSAYFWVGYVAASGTITYWDYDTCDPVTEECYTPNALLVDRDVSTASYDYCYYNNAPWTMAYNQNALASFMESTPARNLGADVAALDGWLSVEPLWEYIVSGSAPKPVTLNNAGQAYPYPTNYQSADRLVRLTVRGWYNVPVHLRLIDAPDTSPYAPVGGWAAKGGKTAVPAYEAYDNDVWSETGYSDFGLTTHSDGSSPAATLDVWPGTNNTATFYLKLPHRYAGDNWQVEVTKKTPGGVAVPNKIPSYSALFTGWKRVFVERDRMFRRGNLLDPEATGGQFTPDSNTNPDVLYLYRWDQTSLKTDITKYIQPGDTVAIFDTDAPYPSGAFETATVVSTAFVDAPLNPASCFPPDCGQLSCLCVSVLAATLDRDLNRPYQSSPLDFSSGKSAAVGVILSADSLITDTSTNQINATGSAFYDADMRDIKQPFDDAFVQLIGLRDGSGAVPYVDPVIGLYETGANGRNLRTDFSGKWFKNGPIAGNNYVELMGVRGDDWTGTPGQIAGDTLAINKFSLIFIDTWNGKYPNASDAQKAVQTATNHELGHQFYVNACAIVDDCPKQAAENHHDYRPRWMNSTTGCPAANANPCLMDPTGGVPTSGINRFCKEDLLLGDPEAPCTNFTTDQTAIRTLTDPLPLWVVQ
jgi:hypothetical protein